MQGPDSIVARAIIYQHVLEADFGREAGFVGHLFTQRHWDIILVVVAGNNNGELGHQVPIIFSMSQLSCEAADSHSHGLHLFLAHSGVHGQA